MKISGLFRSLKGKYVQRAASKASYKQYKGIIKDWTKRINRTSCTKVEINPTPRKIVQANGFSKETLETLQTTEFVERFQGFLHKKGYKLPKSIYFGEDFVPRKSDIMGINYNNHMLYNPRSIKILDLRIPIHETGHLLHKRLHIPVISNFGLGKDYYKFRFGQLLKKIPFFKKYFGETQICHLSRKEQEILMRDLERAWKEGYFKHNPIAERLKDELSRCKSPAEAKKLRKELNRLFKDFHKNPVKYYLPNSQLNRYEFVADYFNLAAQGFKFSPEIARKYAKYGGPKIGEAITKADMEYLEQLRKQISKKSLGDYGYQLIN